MVTTQQQTRQHTQPQTSNDPVFQDVPGHGNTIAAWAMFGVMFIGVVIGCLAFVWANLMGVAIGGGVIILGLIVGLVLKAAGFGVGGKHTKSDH